MQNEIPISDRRAKGHRWGFLKIVGILAVLALIGIQAWPELERNFKLWLTIAVFLIAALLTIFWFAFLSRIRWRSRFLGLALLAFAGFGFSKVARINGVLAGTGLPSIGWKWTAPQQATLEALSETPPPASALASKIPDVPQFFGPNRDGKISGAKLARDWTAHPPKEIWRHPIGAGWSAFSVVGGRAFTQEQRGENEAVTCYDVLTGKLLWVHTDSVRFYQWQAGEGPHATPTIFREHVFTYGATGILNCLDIANGQVVWSRDVLKENNLANLQWATSASPLVFDETVVVTGGENAGPTLLAFIRATGEPLWRAGTDRASYASPILTNLAGKSVILSLNAASLTAHDPATGDVVLNFAWANAGTPKAAQPVVLPGDRVFLSAGYGSGCIMLQIKAGANGHLEATQLWKNLRMKNQFNSVAVRDGFLYGLDDGGLACLDIETGERCWKDGHYGSGQSLLVDDLVLVQSESGAVVFAAAKPDAFHLLGSIPALDGKTWNHPTLAGRYLLVRNDNQAACYELPGE